MTARPSEPRLQKQEETAPSRPKLDFAEPSPGSFDFISQVSLTQQRLALTQLSASQEEQLLIIGRVSNLKHESRPRKAPASSR